MSDPLPWRLAYASTQGSSHVESGLPCQDSSLCTILEYMGIPVLIAAVSDGAGSAAHSDIGSRLACTSFSNEITALLNERGVALRLEREHIETWLADFAQLIEAESSALGLTPRDLACTFLAAVVTPSWSAFCQVGDGGIVIGLPDDSEPRQVTFELVFWPEQGEYANETYFATAPGASQHLQFRVEDRVVPEVALFSDGLQRLVLRFDTRAPFVPFFHRMLQTVRRASEDGELVALSRELGVYLGSAAISERTDDDVSLVLASRFPEMADPVTLAPDVPAAVAPVSDGVPDPDVPAALTPAPDVPAPASPGSGDAAGPADAPASEVPATPESTHAVAPKGSAPTTVVS